MQRQFNREEHVYRSDAFEEIIEDTIRFFNGTPVIDLPPTTRFHGTGVYAIYYIGDYPIYAPLAEKNRLEFSMPIYVGKAVPSGWRQSRNITATDKKTYELHRSELFPMRKRCARSATPSMSYTLLILPEAQRDITNVDKLCSKGIPIIEQ